MKQEIVSQSIKSSPPAAIAFGSILTGITLNEWVAIATLIYILLQSGYLVFKWVRDYRAGRPTRKHNTRRSDRR